MKWTKEQKIMLKSDMTNEEIAAETGRTVNSVRKGRYAYTGHSCDNPKIKTHEEKLFEAEKRAMQVRKEERLKELCKILGVRIG